MNSRTHIAIWVVGIAAVILFGLLVWPTVYRYDHIDMGLGRSYPTKTNRVTGRTEILFREGWKEARNPQPATSPIPEVELNPDELAKLDVRASLEGSTSPKTVWNRLCLDIYNGSSNLSIKEVTGEVSVFNSKKEPLVTHRRYRMRVKTEGFYEVYPNGVQPFQTGRLSTSLGFDFLPGQSWSFALVSAKGTKD